MNWDKLSAQVQSMKFCCVCKSSFVQAPCEEVATISTVEDSDYKSPMDGSYNFENTARGAGNANKDLVIPFAPSPSLSRSSSRNSLGSRAAVHEFEVQVEKGSGSIGMDIALTKDGKALLVGRLKEGAVQDRNAWAESVGEKDTLIQRGDRILEVNGSGRGDSAALLAAVRGSRGTVLLKIARLLEFKVANLLNVPRDNLGFAFGEGPGGELLLTSVGRSANKSLQADMELRAGDCIVRVNETSGTSAELRSKIEASDALTLRVRRSDW